MFEAANDYYGHLYGVEMLMRGDRLLNSETTGYGKWEMSGNQTHFD
ncbi:MAG: hypothetical protein ACUVQ0_04320 [Thermoproteota archaeon]